MDRPDEINRPHNIYFRECRNVRVEGVRMHDPASWNQAYDQCRQVIIDNINVDCKSYWNNDGIDIVDCDSVRISNSFSMLPMMESVSNRMSHRKSARM